MEKMNGNISSKSHLARIIWAKQSKCPLNAFEESLFWQILSKERILSSECPVSLYTADKPKSGGTSRVICTLLIKGSPSTFSSEPEIKMHDDIVQEAKTNP